ncbi:unnamed protein product [Paramecium primaurelia]|uniref:Uncharacterized protein n=1 Tax=Paramecium primaurelia TaxID=5886 RepID=A0A8S1KCJ0_PARPR|nr:unnamed protein product [Paramecium primaurelia]
MIFKLLGWVTNGILDKLEILQLIRQNALILITDFLHLGQCSSSEQLSQRRNGDLNNFLKQIYILINEKLITPLQDLQPTDFSVARQKDCGNNQYSYKLIISNSCNGFIFLDFFISDTLNNQISNVSFFWEPTYDQISDSLKISLIILTSDVSQYGFKFEFTAHSTVNTLLTSKALSAAIFRYGNLSVMNKLAIHDVYKSLVIPYRDQNFIYVCVYNLDLDSSSLISTVIIGRIILSNGKDQEESPIQLGLFFAKKDNFFSHKQKIPHKFMESKNRQFFQKITQIAYNDFHEERIQFKLIVKIVNQYDCIAEINNVQIYPTADEFLQWQVSQNLFDIVSLRYSLEQEQSDFSFVQQIQQIGESINHFQTATYIISSKAKLTKNRLWSNQFGFLNKNGSKCSIFFTNNTNIYGPASLNQVFDIEMPERNADCIDFVLLSTNTFITDLQYLNQL